MSSTRAESGSVSFDRAVSYYDRTRGLSERTTARVTTVLSGELRDCQPCLEIGVGTGRMALPLHAAGVDVMGVDLSEAMMRKLIERSGGSRPFALARANATGLPFRDRSFRAALACHVLHLIPDWHRALDELIRVVGPGGRLLVDAGHGRSRTWGHRVHQRFFREAGVQHDRHVGLDEPHELDDVMAARGTPVRMLPAVREARTVTMEEGIGRLEEGLYSNTWPIPPVVRRKAAAATRRWARERFGDLDRPRRLAVTIQWRAYDLA